MPSERPDFSTHMTLPENAPSRDDGRPVRLLIDVREVAALLSCSRGAVYKLINGGELRIVKLGRLTRIPASEINSFLGRVMTSPPACVGPGGR